MAKQTGLHLIKGKVGEYSYYRSAGVDAPLMRRINQGMSARVKNGEEYANTRLNNAEFKNAQALATFLFNAVPSRKASMMRRFAIAEMTKKGLEYIKDGSGNWGARIPSVGMDGIAVDLLENRAKSGPYQGEYGLLEAGVGSGNAITINLEISETLVADLAGKGIDGFYALVVKGALAEVVDTSGFVRQIFGVTSISPIDVTPIQDGTETLSTFTPSAQSLGMSSTDYYLAQGAENNGMYAVISFLPYRAVGSQRHTLYEYATFACLNLGALPE